MKKIIFRLIILSLIFFLKDFVVWANDSIIYKPNNVVNNYNNFSETKNNNESTIAINKEYSKSIQEQKEEPPKGFLLFCYLSGLTFFILAIVIFFISIILSNIKK